jgi:hypothetical protein
MDSTIIKNNIFTNIYIGEKRRTYIFLGICNDVHAVGQWLRHCATNRKVAGSIPDGVIGIFH